MSEQTAHLGLPTANAVMRVRSIAPWFGGKRTLARRIVGQLGSHVQYFEPFCGSMAVLFAKQQSKQETVNDLHGDIINLARVLQDVDAAVQTYDRLQRTLFCEGLLHSAQEHLESTEREIEPLRVTNGMTERAYWYFLSCWMARNGVAGTARQDYQAAVRWTAGGGSPTIRFRNAIDSIPAWHERLRNVVILQRDAFTILDRFEDSSTTAIYADPPYPKETRTGFRGGGNSECKYLHDFAHADDGLFGGHDDHARLAESLRAYKHARIVLSSYDCPRIRELYDGWTIVECHTRKVLAAQSARGSRPTTDAPEVLVINGESRTGGQ